MNLNFKILIITLSTLIVSCGSIDQSTKVRTSGSTFKGNIIAGKGDVVLEVIRQEDMPNAFGKADLFGRKRDVGTTSVVYLGLNENNAVFLRRDVDISSSKTTMNSSPTVINQNSTSYHSGNVGGTSYSGTSTTYTAPIFLPPNTPKDRITGIREMEITVATLGESNFILIAGKILEVISADNNQVIFKLSDPE